MTHWQRIANACGCCPQVLIKSFAFTFRLYIKEITNQVCAPRPPVLACRQCLTHPTPGGFA